MPVDVLGEIQGVLARETLGQFRIPLLERLDDFQMIDDRTLGAIVLGDGCPANGAHVNQKIARGVDQGL